MESVCMDQFVADIRAIEKQLLAEQGVQDQRHFNRVVWIQRALFVIGLATAPRGLSLVSIAALSTALFLRWTVVAHHVIHGGYEFSGLTKKFGMGIKRRVLDWLDWMLPEAWMFEHNRLHHYFLGEVLDPDQVEHNFQGMRRSTLWKPLKISIVCVLMMTWKWYYYASNTFSLYSGHGGGSLHTVPSHGLWFTLEFLVLVIFPYFSIMFLIFPLLLAKIGFWFGWSGVFGSVLGNLVLAELLTNVHSFLCIATNHCGSDLWRFTTSVDPKTGEWYWRQIVGSTNYPTLEHLPPGSWLRDLVDMMHGFLNYQIEHHLWPNLSALSYQKARPLVQAVCRKHGIPYVCGNIWTRTFKTIKIIIGSESMNMHPIPLAKSKL